MLLESQKTACCVADIQEESTKVAEPVPVEKLEGYIICKSLEYKEEDIKEAYAANDSKISSFFVFY